MMDINNIYKHALTDEAVVKQLGHFIRHHRLEQNKTQSALATEAGINRSTLVEFEQGTVVNLITFVRLLRALKLLSVLDAFEIKEELSPLQLAEMDLTKRKRASKNTGNKLPKTTDW
ncbi:MAG: helix-turn-helix transcriptional regulator [Bacteroidota bacterium]